MFQFVQSRCSKPYATGRAEEIDQVVNYITLIRRLKKQELFDLGSSNEDGPSG